MINQSGGNLHLSIPYPNTKYVDKVIGSNSFEQIGELLRTFGKDTGFSKEISESYSFINRTKGFFEHLKKKGKRPIVLHIGDGSRCLTGAMTTLFTDSHNISVDPIIRNDLVGAWFEKWAIRRLSWSAKPWEESAESVKSYINFLNEEAGEEQELFISCVHGHVDIKKVAETFNWKLIYSLACCQPHKQLPDMPEMIEEGQDWSVLSPQRKYRLYFKN